MFALLARKPFICTYVANKRVSNPLSRVECVGTEHRNVGAIADPMHSFPQGSHL